MGHDGGVRAGSGPSVSVWARRGFTLDTQLAAFTD